MERGDIVGLQLEEQVVLFCVVGFYQKADSDETMVILAMIDPEQLLHIPLYNLQNTGVSSSKWLN
ncbi:MAG: hypothetical protein ACOX5W_08875 [Bacillota bacterium]|jgi:hypothetical protein